MNPDPRREFFSEGRLEFGVDQELASSWKRCLEFGLRPDGKAILARQAKPLFEHRKNNMERLLGAAKDELDNAVQLFGGLEFGIMLTDAEGVVLDTRLNRAPYLHKFMRPGLNLSERRVGTSAMALVINSGRSRSVIGDEHFFSNIHHLTCYAEPIFDPNGDLTGVLNIATTKVMPERTARQILVGIADIIGVNLVKSLSGHFLRFGYGVQAKADDGAIAFGPDGEVMGANKVAFEMLGLNMQLAPELQFSDIFDAQFSDLMSGRFKSRKLLAARLASTPYFVVREVSKQGRITSAGAPSAWLGDASFEKCLEDAALSLKSRRPAFLQGPSGSGKTHAAQWLSRQTIGAKDKLHIVAGAKVKPGDLDKLFAVWRSEPQAKTVLFSDVDTIGPKEQAALAGFLTEQPQVFVICSSSKTGDGVAASHLIPSLYYVLRPERIVVPALSERDGKAELIEKLIRQYLPGRNLTLAARNALFFYDWPGNFRELFACLSRIAVLCPEGTVVTLDRITPMLETPMTEGNTRQKAPVQLNVTEAQAILQALDYCNGNRSAAARRLGISRATLHRRLKAAEQTGH